MCIIIILAIFCNAELGERPEFKWEGIAPDCLVNDSYVTDSPRDPSIS